MKSVSQTTLGIAVLVAGVPSTAAEYDEMAKEVGACLDDAVSNAIYRGWLNTFRTKYVEALDAKFKSIEPRKSTTVTDPTTNKSTTTFEKDKVYTDRLEAVLAAHADYGTAEKAHAALQEVGNAVAASLPFTLTTVRTGGKVAKEWLEAADSIIEAVEANADAPGDYTKFVTNITNLVGGFQFAFEDNGKPTRDSIALALRARMEQKKREASDEQKALAGL